MRHVRPSVDASRARDLVRKGWFAWARALARLMDRNSAYDRLEMIWLPVYLVRIELRQGGKNAPITCSIDGLAGSFALFEMHDEIVDGEPEGESFSPVLDRDDAERIAREGLVTAILRRRSQSGKPLPGDTQSIELLQWPFWVYYHRRRRRGRLDLKLLDAATGRPVGQKLKLASLDAFQRSASGQSG